MSGEVRPRQAVDSVESGAPGWLAPNRGQEGPTWGNAWLSRRQFAAAAGLSVAVSGLSACKAFAEATHESKGGPKLVFAHYFPPYPISIDNRPPSEDAYTVKYLDADGEDGKHAASAGFFRDRPKTQDPLNVKDWEIQNYRTEIRTASSFGIDGFFVDILALSGVYFDRVVDLLAAGLAEDDAFKFVLQPDMLAQPGEVDPFRLAKSMDGLIKKFPNLHRDEQGRTVISPVAAEVRPADWWQQFIAALSSLGQKVVLWPIFIDIGNNLDEYLSQPDYIGAIGEWGARTPEQVRRRGPMARLVHEHGKKWIGPVVVQDNRLYNGRFWEAGNTELLRAHWARAAGEDLGGPVHGGPDDQPDVVLMVTWNDYSENTGFAPSVAHGEAFLEISKYFITKYKTGVYPKPVGDTVCVTHRTHRVDAKPVKQDRVMKASDVDLEPPRDMIEVFALVEKPCDITVENGSVQEAKALKAGLNIVTAPLGQGEVSVTLTRESDPVTRIVSPAHVRSSIEVQDLAYHAVLHRSHTR